MFSALLPPTAAQIAQHIDDQRYALRTRVVVQPSTASAFGRSGTITEPSVGMAPGTRQIRPRKNP